jgi:hypothetical protein
VVFNIGANGFQSVGAIDLTLVWQSGRVLMRQVPLGQSLTSARFGAGCLARFEDFTGFLLTARFELAMERFSIDTKNSRCLAFIAPDGGQNGVDVITFKLL